MMYPLKMAPVFKRYLWGGDNLRALYNKQTPDGGAAESWEVSCHPNGRSAVANGVYAGRTLADVIQEHGAGILGQTVSVDEKFPLLLKLLDAGDRLSVQVHPSDDYAAAHENGEKGKTELWYILHCEPGARLVYGFRDGVTAEQYAKAAQGGGIEELLNFTEVQKGDVFFIPAGTVHAVGAGMIIAEIQQNSDTTYRVYDYNRVGADGVPRALHIDKALDVSSLSGASGNGKTAGDAVKEGENLRTRYIRCRYFTFEKLEVAEKSVEHTQGRMELLLFTEGGGEVGGERFSAGDAFVIPASLGEYEIKGRCTALKAYVE
jgi:mannose-6-phosphate isomerase